MDFRSDQFSFGAMLYEMATGRRAFQKKTAIDTLAAILNEEPEPIASGDGRIPAPLRWIIERCLSKEARERYASTQDLARDLATLRDHLSESISSGSVATVEGGGIARRRRLNLPVAGAIAAALALLIGGALSYRWLASRGVKAEVPSVRQLTFRRGNIQSALFGPDGRTVIYAAAWDGKPADIFTVRTDSTDSRSLGLPPAELRAVSSKGELAIILKKKGLGGGTLARAPLSGGTPREILEDVWDADWAPNGEDLAVLRQLPNGNRGLQYPIGTTLAEGNSISGVRVSRTGELVGFIDQDMGGTTLVTVDRKGKRSTVSRGWGFISYFAWSPRGDELFLVGSRQADERALYAVSLAGHERLLANIVHDMVLYDVAPDGRILAEYFRGLTGMACQRAGEDRERELALHDSMPSDISQDGQFVLFKDSSVPGEVLLRRTDGPATTRLGKGDPMGLSNDGRSALAIVAGPPLELVLIPTGTGLPKKIPIEDVEPQQGLLLPNGKGYLVLGKKKDDPILRLFLVGPDGGKARLVQGTEGLTPAAIGQPWVASPDGERFAYLANDRLLRVGSISSGEMTKVPGPPLEGDDFPGQWSADGRFLFVMRQGGMGVPAQFDRLELATGRRELWRKLLPADPAGVLGIGGGFAISRDGLSYTYSYSRVLISDLFVVEGVR